MIVRSRVEDVTWSGSVSKIDFENPAQNQDYYYGGDDGTETSSKYPFYVTLDESENLMLGQHVYVEPDLGQDSQEDEGSWRLPSWYISDLDTAPFVWAQGSSGKLEKRLVALGSQNEMGEYEITEGLTLEDKIAFPEEGLEEGMICVDYREYTPSEEENYEDYNVEDVPAGYGEEFDLEDGEDYIFDDSDYFEEDWDDDSDDEDYDEDDEDYEDDEDDSDEDDSEDE
mgnify:CR=1 FL=1